MKKHQLILLFINLVILSSITIAQHPGKINSKKVITKSKVTKKITELTTTDITTSGFIDATQINIFGFHLGMTREQFQEEIKKQPNLECNYFGKPVLDLYDKTIVSLSYIDKEKNIKPLIMVIGWEKGMPGISIIKLQNEGKDYFGASKKIFDYDPDKSETSFTNLLKNNPGIYKKYTDGSYFIYPQNHIVFEVYAPSKKPRSVTVEFKLPESMFDPVINGDYKEYVSVKNNKTSSLVSNEVVTDIDKNIYKTVIIGDREWLAENLNVSHFRNGDIIPESKNMEEWYKAGDTHKPSWCYYNYNSKYGKIYGKLYNSYAITDKRGLAPTGWRVSLEKDWSDMVKFLGGEFYANKLKATSGWGEEKNFYNPNGTNTSGFTGLPGGTNLASTGQSTDEGGSGNWWSITADKKFTIWELDNSSDDRIIIHKDFDLSNSGFSVRCVKD